MPLVPQDVRGVSTRSMSEAQRVREEGAAARTSDAEAKPVQVDLLLQLQQMMAEQARRQEEQARRQEEQARRQEEQARCQAEQLRELKEEQARRQEEQARRQEEQARCQAEQLRELKEDQARRQEDQARRQEEQARRLEEMHKDFTKGLQKAVERVQEVEEGLGKLEHRVKAIEERVEEEISKIKQEVTSLSPLKSRSRLAAVFEAPNAASSATKGLKIPHYDGTTSWTAFKLQFETLMEAYGWTQKEAQSALILALRDQALSVLEAIGASGDLSFSALLDALEARFGDSHLEHVYRAQLKERTQRANEGLQQWSVEIEKLVRRAFRSTPSMIEGTLLQAFIDGIRDPEVRAAVHLGHHKNMKEALAHALEVEAVRGNSRTLRLREMTTTEQVPPRRRNFMCYGCGERGHIRSDCPKKRNRQDAAVSTSDQQGNLNPARAAGWALAGSGTTPTIYIKQTNDGNTLVIDGQICGKSFNSRDNRNTHRFVHSDKKPYECVACGAGYMRKQLLYAHMNTSGHLAESIVVNQPRVIKVTENGTSSHATDITDLDTKTSKFDAIFEAHTELEASIKSVKSEADVNLEDAKFYITEDKKLILQDSDKTTLNLIQEGDESTLLTIHNIGERADATILEAVNADQLSEQTEIVANDENGGMVRLIQIKLPDGNNGWVASIAETFLPG
ncbi:unnamed protein product [Spodoptera exigua]|nr:unnamed protein product [Spodoptera exigua]